MPTTSRAVQPADLTGPHGGPRATLALARPKLNVDTYTHVPGTERCRVSSPTGGPHATPARRADLPLAVKDRSRDQARCLDCRRALARSEERRVGKECRSRWSP